MANLLEHPANVFHPLPQYYIKHAPTYELEFFYDAMWKCLDESDYFPANPYAMEQSLMRIEKEVTTRGYLARDSRSFAEYVPVPFLADMYMGFDDESGDGGPYQPPQVPYAPMRPQNGRRRRFGDIFVTSESEHGQTSGTRSGSMEERCSSRERGPRVNHYPGPYYNSEGGSANHRPVRDGDDSNDTIRRSPEPSSSHVPDHSGNAPYEQRPWSSPTTTYDTSYSETRTTGNDRARNCFNAKTNYFSDPMYGRDHGAGSRKRPSGFDSGTNHVYGNGPSASDPIPTDPIPTDPYVVLGVSRRASASEIEKAHKDLIKTHHPDRHVGKSEHSMKRVNDMAAAINEARDLLLDKKAREVYDKTGQKGDQAVKEYEALRNMHNMYKGAGYGSPNGFGRRDGGEPSRYY